MWTKNKRTKKIIYDDSLNFHCNNVMFNKIRVDDGFKYLGAEFMPSGLCKISVQSLQYKIKVLLKAPAKPQQKVFMLRNFLLPSFYHSYIFF